MKNNIIVPTDLTTVADKAIEQACLIALTSKSNITLLHVLNDKSASEQEVRSRLEAEATTIRSKHGIDCDVMIKEGNLFEVIPYVTCENDFNLMVIGTHGIKGIKQKLFGANILNLVEKVSIPVLVVQ